MKIKSATIHCPGDPSVGIPRTTFELSGGDFIVDLSVFGDDPLKLASEFRSDLEEFAENWLSEKVYVTLEGFDEKRNLLQ